MKPILKTKQELPRAKTSFYASDMFRLEPDILLPIQGVLPTNPPTWEDKLKFEAGKSIELSIIDTLKFNGIIDENFDQEKEEATEIVREGAPIRMRFDGRVKVGGAKILVQDSTMPVDVEVELKEGAPIECKSINNKNAFDISEYQAGNPRDNYVAQLSVYMDALGHDKGYLFCATIDGLHTFWFECKKIKEGIYQAGNTIVDIGNEYKRFGEIWKRKDQEPKWDEETYMLPIEQIDWTKQSKTAIQNARTNKKVIGTENSWKILYSSYRDLILQKQGVEKRGYSDETVERICTITKGYSAK